MSDVKLPSRQSPILAELLLAPSFEELQNAATAGRMASEQFCNFWRKAAAQAQLRGNLASLRKLLQLLGGSPAVKTVWGRLLFHQYRGLLLLSEGHFDQAFSELLAQRQVAWDLADATELALANLELAQASLQIFHLDPARQYLTDAAHWAKLVNEPLLQVRLLNLQANLVGQQHQTEQSLDLAQQALALAQQHRFRLEQAIALHRIGINLMYHRDWEGAEKAIRDALRLRQTVRDPLGQAEALLSLGNLQLRHAQPEAAVQSVNAGLAMMEKLENPFGIAQALYQKAQLLLKNRQFEEALPWAIKAVELRLQQGEPTRLAQAFSQLAQLYIRQGQNLAALNSHLKVLELYNPENSNPQWVEVLVDAGDYLLRMELPDIDSKQYWQQSFDAYKAAISIIEHNQNLYYLSPVLGRMARALLKLDALDAIPEATRCYQIQLSLLGDIDSLNIPAEEAIAQRAEALTGLQVCASLTRRRQA